MTQSVISIPLSLRFVLVFILVPLVELTLLMQLFQRTGFLTSLAVVVCTGVLGVTLARMQGLQLWQEIHRQLAQGNSPSAEIMDGVMILFAGAFLITPGLLTDGVGFCLLIPWVRRRLRHRLTAWFQDRTIKQFGGTRSAMDAGSAPSDGKRPSVRVVTPESEHRSSAAG